MAEKPIIEDVTERRSETFRSALENRSPPHTDGAAMVMRSLDLFDQILRPYHLQRSKYACYENAGQF
jgi:hypothetical protein